jgi:hypothetical protein
MALTTSKAMRQIDRRQQDQVHPARQLRGRSWDISGPGRAGAVVAEPPAGGRVPPIISMPRLVHSIGSSPATRPAFITITRSASARISSSSLDTTSTAPPASRMARSGRG